MKTERQMRSEPAGVNQLRRQERRRGGGLSANKMIKSFPKLEVKGGECGAIKISCQRLGTTVEM